MGLVTKNIHQKITDERVKMLMDEIDKLSGPDLQQQFTNRILISILKEFTDMREYLAQIDEIAKYLYDKKTAEGNK